MKNLFLFLSAASVLTMCLDSSDKAITFDKSEIDLTKESRTLPVECPECTKEFYACSNAGDSVYMATVEKEADKFKAGIISRTAYDETCAKAEKELKEINDKCKTTYQACCLEETRKRQEKQ